jgi:hypothetical protein
LVAIAGGKTPPTAGSLEGEPTGTGASAVGAVWLGTGGFAWFAGDAAGDVAGDVSADATLPSALALVGCAEELFVGTFCANRLTGEPAIASSNNRRNTNIPFR